MLVDASATREQIDEVYERISMKANYSKVESLEEEMINNYYLKSEATDFKDDCDIQLDELRESIKPLAKKAEVAKVKEDLK